MYSCFICNLLGKASQPLFTAYIDHTIEIIENVKESVLIKTFLFGWIKIFEDKIVKKFHHVECNKRYKVCCDHKNVTNVTSYKGYGGKKPQITVNSNYNNLLEEIDDTFECSAEEMDRFEEFANRIKYFG